MSIKNIFKIFLPPSLLLALALIAVQARAAAYDYDLAISNLDLKFSKDILISGDTVRIYASVTNRGNKDITGYVSFFRGSTLIGNSQPVSVLPNSSDDVFVDFIVPEDSFNVQAKIQGTEPADQNSSNDGTQSKLVIPDRDTDSDGTVDRLDADDDNDGLTDDEEKAKGTNPLKKDSDNDGYDDKNDAFPLNANEWLDTDSDGTGNNSDADDDNDGWIDKQELSRGTDPLRKDTDGDGINDANDYYPLDGTKTAPEQERNIFQPSTPEDQSETPNNALPQSNSGNQDIGNLDDLKNQLSNLAASKNLAVEKGAAAQNKPDDTVESTFASAQSFLRLNNPVLWIILAILIVMGIIAYLAFWQKRNLPKIFDLLSPNKPGDFKTIAVSAPISKIRTESENKAHPKIINLKDFKKGG